ncbi:MAG: hypothetical protein M1827_007749 [Pycnora praestabilis]|nr:MAG: hypothetical protein M1827_007749 [Pycnora praestabilis]
MKREKKTSNHILRQAADFRPNPPVSSGDTVSDAECNKMTTQLETGSDHAVDEGYQTGHMEKQRGSDSFDAARNSGDQHADFGLGADSLESLNALDILGRGVKKLVLAIDGLRQLGVENFVLPLPKIVVVGDQSTGKSSVIEAISEIKVPRNVGTCTRCPLEINLREDGAVRSRWECKVSLRKKYIYDISPNNAAAETTSQLTPTKRSSVKATAQSRSRPLGPWVEQDTEEFHFCTLHSKEDVENALFWAQLATLNPGIPHHEYIPCTNMATSQTRQVDFSPNVVRLEISGPQLPNLSFTDLPGIINITEDEEEKYLVKLVKNLVKEYIKAENCIILLALPMTDDAANSTAAGIIKEVGAQSRTVGVLTKPDRMSRGDPYDQWNMMLSGEKYRLGHGYFVCKNPSQASIDKGLDHAQARADEAEFFAKEEPWATKLSLYKERFGTVQLQTALSQKLTMQILSSLPHINEEISRKAKTIDTELAGLPEPPADNLPMTIMQKLNNFSRELQQYLDGGYPCNSFQKNWNNLAEQFTNAIALSHPMIIVSDPSEMVPGCQDEPGDYGDVLMHTPGTPTPRRPQTQAIDLDTDDDVPVCKPEPIPFPPRKRSAPSNTGTPQSIPKKKLRMVDLPPFTTTKGLARKFKMPEIREIIQDAHVAGIPDQVDPKAIVRMCQAGVEHWDKPMTEFLQSTGGMLRTMVSERFTASFGTLKHTALFTEASDIINGFINGILEEQRQAAQRAYQLEVSSPLTMNKKALSHEREQAAKTILKKRRNVRIAAYFDALEARTGKVITELERIKKMPAMTDELLGPDPFSKELDVMSTVRGYYECAASRFVDTICLSLKAEMFVRCGDVHTDLIKDLGIMQQDANDRCARLMAEDPQREIKRAQLKKEKETLRQAQEWLAGLAGESTEA